MKNKNGYVLIEIMMGIVVISITITSLTAMLISSTRATLISKNKINAGFDAIAYAKILKDDFASEKSSAFLETYTATWDDGHEFVDQGINDSIILEQGTEVDLEPSIASLLGTDSFSYNLLYSTDEDFSKAGKSLNKDNVEIELVNIKKINSGAWTLQIKINILYYENKVYGGDINAYYVTK